MEIWTPTAADSCPWSYSRMPYSFSMRWPGWWPSHKPHHCRYHTGSSDWRMSPLPCVLLWHPFDSQKQYPDCCSSTGKRHSRRQDYRRYNSADRTVLVSNSRMLPEYSPPPEAHLHWFRKTFWYSHYHPTLHRCRQTPVSESYNGRFDPRSQHWCLNCARSPSDWSHPVDTPLPLHLLYL